MDVEYAFGRVFRIKAFFQQGLALNLVGDSEACANQDKPFHVEGNNKTVNDGVFLNSLQSVGSNGQDLAELFVFDVSLAFVADKSGQTGMSFSLPVLDEVIEGLRLSAEKNVLSCHASSIERSFLDFLMNQITVQLMGSSLSYKLKVRLGNQALSYDGSGLKRHVYFGIRYQGHFNRVPRMTRGELVFLDRFVFNFPENFLVRLDASVDFKDQLLGEAVFLKGLLGEAIKGVLGEGDEQILEAFWYQLEDEMNGEFVRGGFTS